MEYDVEIDDLHQAVFCVCKGTLDLGSAKAMTRDVRRQSFELGYGLLYDVTNVTLGVGIGDAYFYPRDIANIYDDLTHRQGKAAIIYATDEKFWKFFELSAQNAGVNVKLFREREEAIKWFSGEETN